MTWGDRGQAGAAGPAREERRRAWNRYREAAVSGAVPRPEERATTVSELVRDRALQWWTVDATAGPASSGRWRDLRLVPLGAAAWLGAALAPVLTPLDTGSTVLPGPLGAVLLAVLCVAACASFLGAGTRLAARKPGSRSRGRTHASRLPRASAWPPRPRGVLRHLARASMVTACTAASLAAGLVAGAAHGAAERAGPAGELLARGGPTVATVEILGEPSPQRQSGSFGSGPRFSAPGRLLHATGGGRAFTASAPVRLIGGTHLEQLRPGTTVEVPGRVVPATRPGGAALLSVAGAPRAVSSDGARQVVGDVRRSLRESAGWLWEDAAGLLPGMTAGDTSALPADLEEAMRDVGLGHLTAVSGANFTLLLGTVLLALRTVRASRWAAALGCAAALIAFTIVVGPEPSVVRAAAMGAVGLVAVLSGRAARSCSTLSAAVLVLVLLEPALALSMGFLLSVAATLGIALLGPSLTQILAAHLPGWLSLAIAVPLSAQLTCGPLIVLIQPSFLTLSLAANLLVAPFVPIVTVAGTLALATCSWCPPVAFLATAVGGAAAQAVAGSARLLAGLPGATAPWPEGPVGAAAMAGVSLLNAALLWAALLPSGRHAVWSGFRGLARLLRGASLAAVGCVGTVLGLGTAAARGRVDG